MTNVDQLKAIANERRLQILDWLKAPTRHFPKQVDGDLEVDGVCAVLIAAKLGISPATLSEHMRVLVQAELIDAKRIKQWTFYKRNQRQIDALTATLSKTL